MFATGSLSEKVELRVANDWLIIIREISVSIRESKRNQERERERERGGGDKMNVMAFSNSDISSEVSGAMALTSRRI